MKSKEPQTGPIPLSYAEDLSGGNPATIANQADMDIKALFQLFRGKAVTGENRCKKGVSMN